MVRSDARGEPTRFERDKREERENSGTEWNFTEWSFAVRWTGTTTKKQRPPVGAKRGRDRVSQSEDK